MPSDDRRGFRAAIRRSPEDDAPRLVYADWLAERGEADRAEFVRVRCALAKLGPDRRKGRKERARLEPREKTLRAAHGDRWLDPLRAVLRGSNPWDRGDGWLDRLAFRRGFVNANHFGLESARRLAAAGDAVEPVDHLSVTECGARYCHDSVVEITRWPGAGCLVGFSVAWGTARDVAAVVRPAPLRDLRNLGVWRGGVTDAGAAELAAWPAAVSLQGVNSQDNPIADAGASARAESPHLGRLRRLDLPGTWIGPSGRDRLRQRFGDALRM